MNLLGEIYRIGDLCIVENVDAALNVLSISVISEERVSQLGESPVTTHSCL